MEYWAVTLDLISRFVVRVKHGANPLKISFYCTFFSLFCPICQKIYPSHWQRVQLGENHAFSEVSSSVKVINGHALETVLIRYSLVFFLHKHMHVLSKPLSMLNMLN